MLTYISALVLLSLALLVIAMQKAYYFYPARELKRQARAGDREAKVFYKAVAYGGSLRLLLWLLVGIFVAASFMLLTVVAPAWLVFVAVVGLIWYGFAWSPNAAVGRLGARLTLIVTPALSWVLYYAHPLLHKVTRFVEQRRPVTFHTGIFERSDLIELIQSQKDVEDSRIPKGELDVVLHALSFGEKTVGSVMVPKAAVKTVAAGDVVGPILMDELYENNHTRFPVVAGPDDTDNIVGTLFMRDMINARHGGTVRDVMKPIVHYAHEDHSLYQVLHAFLTTKQSQFVVINSDETYVGVITIEDVLEQVIGHKIEDDFESYDDKRAVAAHAKLPPTGPQPEPGEPEPPLTVVE